MSRYSKLTKNNRYILHIVHFSIAVVLCLSSFTPYSSPHAQTSSLENGDIVREQETGNLYQVATVLLNDQTKKYKRFLRDQQSVGTALYTSANPTKSVTQRTLAQYELNDVVLVQKPESNVLEYDFYRIFPNNTVKQLIMSRPDMLNSGYVPAFYATQAEIDRYAKAEPLYYTGTTRNESNVYRDASTLKPNENRTRIYKAIIPEGENRCSLQGDFVAVIGKPGATYTTITNNVGWASLSGLQGGAVTVYLQTFVETPYPSFTLECRQTSPLNEHIIDTVALPNSEITFTKTGTGEQSFDMVLAEGFHYCTIMSNEKSARNPLSENLYVQNRETSAQFPLNSVIVGKRYGIHITNLSSMKPSYQGAWTLQCYRPHTIPLNPNTVNRITGNGSPSVFRLSWASGTKLLRCRGSDSHISLYNNALDIWQVVTAVQPEAHSVSGNAFLSVNANQAWTVFCSSSDAVPETRKQNINYTPFITGPQTTQSLRDPNNPNLLRNVVARADGVTCANHLLGLDALVGDILLVPEDLCIRYITVDIPFIGGIYDATTSTIRINTPVTLEDAHLFNAFEKQKQITLVHELCHAQQDYYAESPDNWGFLNPEFATITGHQLRLLKEFSDGYKSYGWYYPNTGSYFGMYGAGFGSADHNNQYDMFETGAEFCMVFASANAQRIDIVQDMVSETVPVNEMLGRILNNSKAQSWITRYMLNPYVEPLLSPDTLTNLHASNIRITDIAVAPSGVSFTLQGIHSQPPSLSTKLTQQGWRVAYDIGFVAVQDSGFGQSYSPLMLGNDSYRFEGVRIDEHTATQKLIIVPILENSINAGQQLILYKSQTEIEFDIYQLLVDRGLLQ